MLINISIDTSTETTETIGRLAQFLTGTSSLTPVRQVTEATTDTVSGENFDAAEPEPTKLVTIEEPDPSIQVNEPPRRGRPKKTQTSPIIVAVTEAKNDLTQTLDNLPGVTELTATETPAEVVETPDAVQETAPEVTQVPEQEEVTLDLTTEDDNQEEVIVQVTPEPKSDLPPIEGMDGDAAGAEIRRLVIKNTGAWLRDMLGANKVGRISELSLEQAHKAIAEGRVKAGEV